jgi:hypothetical protein
MVVRDENNNTTLTIRLTMPTAIETGTEKAKGI